MLYGSYHHSLDEKGRLTLPSKLRPLLSNKLFVLKGYEGTLAVYTEEAFSQYLDKLSKLTYEDKSSRDVMRVALASVTELELDDKFRVQLPVSLIEKYDISRKIVIVGVIDHLEFWNEDKWEAYLKDNESQFEEKTQSLLGGKNG
ncbi:MAG: division/cell wall cluster transcriptional repressor MraZ [Bacilli bacterium]|nr:division/cell wall cluster transcriptional repressor MraZ [Bacilli bacterium]